MTVRKPGNVSRLAPGHGMHAEMFLASARAASGPMFEPGTRIGARVEAAVRVTLAAAGCNTNLGILLLCAPLALADERHGSASPSAVADVLADLDLADAEAAFRAIAMANPGGLGAAPEQDVHGLPSLDLRRAMALAAERDSIARQYRDGYAELFERGVPALRQKQAGGSKAASGPDVAAVQRLYLTWLAGWPDSHIVRKHGQAVAQNVMATAQVFLQTQETGVELDALPAFAAWDETLKAAHVNPGTSADLTVATLMLAGLQTARVRAR